MQLLPLDANSHTHTRFMASGLVWDYLDEPIPELIWILLKQETVWHQLGHTQICTSLQTDNQASTQHPTTQYFTGWMPFLLPNQRCQSTEGKAYSYKMRISKIQEGGGCILKNCNIFTVDWPILTKFGTVMPLSHPDSFSQKILVFKNRRWKRSPSLIKIVISPQQINRF